MALRALNHEIDLTALHHKINISMFFFKFLRI